MSTLHGKGRARYTVWAAMAAAVAGLMTAVAGLTRGREPAPVTTGTLTIGLKPFATMPPGAGSPQDLVPVGDGRLLIATRNGQIVTSDSQGHLGAAPFLDMAASGIKVFTAEEGGFCGLALNPNFGGHAGTPGAGKFYTFTTEPYTPDPPADFSHPEMKPAGPLIPADQVVIREWTVNPADPNHTDPTSRVLMRINHPQSMHHGGGLAFGPDGHLYIALGDGGGGNDKMGGQRIAIDGHTDSTGNAQDLSNVFGKILRIDPLATNSANRRYGIPADNPFSHTTGTVGEIYAYGLRNPYRISFDPPTGQLYAADVGQSEREEVDLIRKGGNYGWVYREGTRYNKAASGIPIPRGLKLIDPIAEYTHWDGSAVIGGFVYRGTKIPALVGKYVFGDYFFFPHRAARLFYADASGGPISEFHYQSGPGLLPGPPDALHGFGRDAAGELYALFDNGQVAQLVPPTSPAAAPLAAATPSRAPAPRRRRH